MKARLSRTLGVLVMTGILAASCGVNDGSAVATTATSPTLAPTSTRADDTTTTTREPFDARSLLVIGNSLTWDTIGGVHDEYLSIDVLARQGATKLEPNGFHINCSASLVDIFEQPSQTCIDPREPGTLTSMLTSPWDVVWLQPYPGPGSTMATDESVIREVARKQPRSTIHILTGWPPSARYRTAWDQPSTDDDETPTTPSRAYFDALASRVSDIDVIVIPVGEVLYRLDERLAAGDVPDLDGISDLYRDDIHLNDLGQWVAGVTAAAVILDTDPLAYGKPQPPWYGENTGFSPEFIRVAREVIVDVLK